MNSKIVKKINKSIKKIKTITEQSVPEVSKLLGKDIIQIKSGVASVQKLVENSKDGVHYSSYWQTYNVKRKDKGDKIFIELTLDREYEEEKEKLIKKITEKLKDSFTTKDVIEDILQRMTPAVLDDIERTVVKENKEPIKKKGCLYLEFGDKKFLPILN